MITEKNLDESELIALDATTGETGRAYLRELFRLAKLGLWAEKYGVPALSDIRNKTILFVKGSAPHVARYANQLSNEALAVLPVAKAGVQ